MCDWNAELRIQRKEDCERLYVGDRLQGPSIGKDIQSLNLLGKPLQAWQQGPEYLFQTIRGSSAR